MDFGLFHLFECPNHRSETETIGEQLDLMQAAEDLGFTSVWAAEHHFSAYGICPSPHLPLAAVARVTKTIRLGTAVVVLPFHNPIRVAEELAFVDQICGGRLDVGLGRGYRLKEQRGFGVDPSQTRRIFQEAAEILLQAWTQDTVHYQGTFFRVEGLPVRPKPLQQPHPRIWVGSLSPSTFGLVGRMGAHLLFTPTFSPEENIPAQIQEYQQAVAAAGQDPAAKRVGALRFVYVADSTEQAHREFREHLNWFYAEAAAQNAAGPGDPVTPDQAKYTRSHTYEEQVASGAVIAGDPDHVIRKLEEMQRSWNLTDLILWTRVGGMDVRKVLHSMELTAKYVIPHFRTERPAAKV